jgi:hypothetical protein
MMAAYIELAHRRRMGEMAELARTLRASTAIEKDFKKFVRKLEEASQ